MSQALLVKRSRASIWPLPSTSRRSRSKLAEQAAAVAEAFQTSRPPASAKFGTRNGPGLAGSACVSNGLWATPR